jgi:hypothetical protein
MNAHAETLDFDRDPAGAAPPGWICGVTGKGKACIEMADSQLAGAGAVGVWTKADGVTAFDDFTFGASTKLPAEAR